MKFQDQHMEDKWVRKQRTVQKMDFRNENKNLVITGLWSFENPVCLLCKNANFTAWNTESCAFGTRI